MNSPRSSMRWSFAANWAQQGVNAAFTFVLAALLGPEAFGIAAIASLFIMFSHILVEQGLNLPLIQQRDLTRLHRDSAFWAILAWALLMAALAAGLADWWGSLNGEPLVAEVVIALSPLLVVQGLCVVPKSQLMRRLDFRALALTVVSASLLSGVAGVILALNDGGVWSLVVFQWVAQLTTLVLLWAFARELPRLAFSGPALKGLLFTGNGAFLNQLGGFATSRADSVLVGLFFGPVAVGLYRLADRLVQVVTTLLSRSVSTFALPFLSRAQKDPAQFRKGTRDCLELSSMLSIPALAMLAALSPMIVHVIGPEWSLAWVAVVLLSVVGGVQSITLMSPQLLNAAGRSHLAAAISWVSAIIESLCFIAVALFFREETLLIQIATISGAKAAISLFIALPFHFYVIRQIAGVPFREVATLLAAPVACAALSAGVITTLVTADPVPEIQGVLKLLIYGIISAAVTLSLMILFSRKLREELKLTLNFPASAAAPTERPES